jgi:dTDP-4-amino-4,6-dideoxygalactose transaminase
LSSPCSIPLCEPSIGGNARRYLQECLDGRMVSSVGAFVDRFEQEFAATVGSRFAVACSSGTAALHVAFRLLGVEPGDEVFLSTLTFVASANPIRYLGATPVFVDAERESWNLDPSLVIEELDRRARTGLRQPKAVEVVHILGQPARIDELIEACRRHGVALVEDAAEALGARYTTGRFSERNVGTLGEIGCFSFNGNKMITCGGGGMITTNDEGLARRARHLTTQAKLPGVEYHHDEVGYNYRLTNIAGALGLAQLEQLPEFMRKKRAIASRYDAGLAHHPGITLPPRPSWSSPSFWLYTIGVDSETFGMNRSALLDRFLERGIQTRPIWTPLHLMSLYKSAPRLGGEVAEELFSRALSLPSSVDLTPQQQDQVIGVIANART